MQGLPLDGNHFSQILNILTVFLGTTTSMSQLILNKGLVKGQQSNVLCCIVIKGGIKIGDAS